MTPLTRRLAAVAAVSLTVLLVLWSCEGSGSGDDGSDGGATTVPDTTETTEPTQGDDGPPAFVPVTGATGEDGTPEPPPVHATFSVVVRGATSWDPYTGPELTSLDEQAAEAVTSRLRQLDGLLRELGIPASIELAYGPAAALCAGHPDLFDELEAGGHRFGIHATSRGEAFRAHRALGECGRVPTTVSGLASMADPAGPAPPTPQSLVDALAVVSVLDLHQVLGRVSPLCIELELAGPTHGYGTGAFTAPWRSGWTEDRPCADLPRGRIVVIDQTALAPGDGATRIGPGAIAALAARTDQVLAYALDQRYVEVVDLPAPGFITWGVTVRLDDLIAPDPAPEAVEEPATDAAPHDEVTGDEVSADPVDPRVALLGEETLTALRDLGTERWLPAMERGRLQWMLPDQIAAIFRPLADPETDAGS